MSLAKEASATDAREVAPAIPATRWVQLILGLMVKWFPDRRGFAVGLAAAGYGFGAIVTTFPIDMMLKASGHRPTLIIFGLLLGTVGVCAALGLRAPRPDEIRLRVASMPLVSAAKDYSPLQM